MSIDERPFWIEANGVRLEGLLHEGDAPLSALILHPHPQYGGDMDNHVVRSIAAAVADLGGATLRLNFRGVGGSSGVYDEGRGEIDDARAAAAESRALRPESALVVAGYSFGAMVAAGVAAGLELRALVLVSPPVAYAPLPELPAGLPVLVVTGERDAIAPAEHAPEPGAPESDRGRRARCRPWLVAGHRLAGEDRRRLHPRSRLTGCQTPKGSCRYIKRDIGGFSLRRVAPRGAAHRPRLAHRGRGRGDGARRRVGRRALGPARLAGVADGAVYRRRRPRRVRLHLHTHAHRPRRHSREARSARSAISAKSFGRWPSAIR